MKFHRSTAAGQNSFTACGHGWVQVNQRRFESSLIVLPEVIVEQWAVTAVSELTLQAFAPLVPHAPEVILLGTGASLRFPPPTLLRALAAGGLGVEVMDTAAACRTYNILVAEGRRVAAALIL